MTRSKIRKFRLDFVLGAVWVNFGGPAGGDPTWRLETPNPHMASRDGELRTRRRNSNTFPRAGQNAVSYGNQLFVHFWWKIANCSGSNHRIPKPRRQNLDLVCSLAHAKPQLPEIFPSTVWARSRSPMATSKF